MMQAQGQWVVRAGRDGSGAWRAELTVPGRFGSLSVRGIVTPEGALQLRQAIRAYHAALHTGDVSGMPLVVGCGSEVGDLGDLLGGLFGGGGGAGGALGGLLGAATGAGPLLGGLGSLLGGGGGGGGGGLGSLLGGLFGGGGSSQPVRPASLPPGGSTANQQRILQFVGITSQTPRDEAIRRLQQGLTQSWAPEDLADARSLLTQLQGAPAVSPAPTPAGGLLPGTSQLLQLLGAGAVSPQSAAAPLGGLSALAQALTALGASSGGSLGGDPLTLLLLRALAGSDAVAGCVAGDHDAMRAWEYARHSADPMTREGIRMAHALTCGR